MNPLHSCGDEIAARYKILNVLGHGGTGITYAAQDLQTNQPVALKALSFHRINDWKALELFEREAKILAHLNHPAIPHYLNYFQIETQRDRIFYLVQQLVPGRSLEDWVNQCWQPSVAQVQEIAAQVLEILMYLQQLTPPVIHRDIKPQNLIRQDNGKIFLVDFGAVQDTYRNAVTGGSTVVGTFGYMAPEQFRGEAVLSTDLYGLGTTLLFLLTKRSPADLPQRQLKINFHAAIELPKHFADWLERMIEPVSTTRFASAQEALAVLQEKQALPPRTPIYQKPKNSAIHLTKADGKLVIDIRATLVNSQLSLGLRLLLLFGTVFSWAISYGWIAEVLEPWLNITPGMELMFRLYVLLLGGIPIVGVCLVATAAVKSLRLSSAFRTRLEIDPKSVQMTRSLGFWRMDARLTSDPSRFQNSILQISLNQHQFPLFKRSYSFCTLQLGTQKLIFGLFLRRDEQAWLVNEIRTFVERHTIVAQQIKKI